MQTILCAIASIKKYTYFRLGEKMFRFITASINLDRHITIQTLKIFMDPDIFHNFSCLSTEGHKSSGTPDQHHFQNTGTRSLTHTSKR